MGAIGDLCNSVRGWLAFEYADPLVLSWVKMAEEWLSENLRCKEMIAIDEGLMSQWRVKLPSDWQELDYVREFRYDNAGTVVGHNRPLLFKSRDQFFSDPGSNSGFYTITGNFITLDDGQTGQSPRALEISYYQDIPTLGDDPNWLYTRYRRLYIAATLSIATSYSIEDARGAAWQASAQEFIDKINTNHQLSRFSGSKLIRPRRNKGFG